MVLATLSIAASITPSVVEAEAADETFNEVDATPSAPAEVAATEIEIVSELFAPTWKLNALEEKTLRPPNVAPLITELISVDSEFNSLSSMFLSTLLSVPLAP